ncbi:MAG: hypothetical protein FJ096_14810 [Deltaproteobacteria bacterium]|nr:hypothetical protein [Deltaproteobacteria bacterium]
MSQDAVPDFTTEADPKDATSGKYFQIRVPNFTKEASTSATKRDGYLRIGSMAKFADTDRGSFLWEQFTGFAADNGIDEHTRDNKGEPVDRQVRYDTQGRLNDVASRSIDDQRTVRKEVLLAEAAWRDHCDGNRITTTSGDKVEIVGGNYQLVVLGRAPDASGSSRDEHSGGNHIDGTVSPPQTVTKISYTPKYTGGSWSMV